MKSRQIAYLLALLLSLVLSSSKAEVITFKIGKDKKISILLNNKLVRKAKYDLSIKNGNTLRFVYVSEADIAAKITIKGIGENTVLNIDSFQLELQKTDTLSTDEELNLLLKNVSRNLNEPFEISFGIIGDPKSVITVEINPVLGFTSEPPNTAQGAAPRNSPDQNRTEVIYKPGSAVYDALKLANSKMVTENELKGILQYYFPDQNLNTKDAVWTAAKNNPFLNTILVPAYQLKSSGSKSQSAAKVSLASAFSSLGGLDVTSLADGMAKFLVKRVKEELSIAFFKKLQKAIESKPDLGTLFPKTVDLLGSLQDDAYDYQKYLQNLRETFKKDIESLDANLPGIIDNHKTFFDKDRHHELAAAIYGGCYITSELKKQVHPGDLIQNYPMNSLKNEPASFTAAIQVLQLLSGSMRDTTTSGSTYWVNISSIRQLVNDKVAFKIYLGLIYQQTLTKYNSIEFDSDKHSLIMILNSAASKYDDVYSEYKTYILQFGGKTQTLNTMIKSYQKPATDSVAIELYKNYFNASIDLVKYAVNITTLTGVETLIPATKFLKSELPKYLNIVSQISDLAIDINRKNYASAINQTVLIYNLIQTNPAKVELAALVKVDTDEQKNHLKSVTDTLFLAKSVTSDLVKYGGFMAAVATAKSSDDVANSIESFVLPSGSSRIKRESAFSVGLNAYTGLYYGHEAIQSVTSHPLFNSYGVTAPIGINIGWGQSAFFNPFGKGHSSISFFLSLVDIGAVASFRFKDDQTSEVPKIALKNRVSPGGFLSLGLPKTPLSINLGAQTGPNLREVNISPDVTAANTPANQTYWRYSISVVVDIPLLNFYTKMK